MPVSHLELENFKSYSGLQRIGPFHDFTSVIGPNGSGKSNLLDAISFVLGVNSRDLRSSQMKDLIFRPPGKTQQTNLRASATLVYKDPDTEEEIRFSRTISPHGSASYKVDGTTVPFKEYEEHLAKIGVLLKARNFLVFQGDVESIARKSPKELVEMLEHISTSAELREAYDEALKVKEEAEAATVFAYNKQKGFKSERKLLRDQKKEAERFHEMLEKKSKLQTDMYLWQLFHIDFSMKERDSVVSELREELGEMEEQEQELNKTLREAKKQASAARRETASADKKRVQLAAAVDKLEPSIIQTTEEIKNLTKKLKSDEKQLTKTQKEADSHGATLSELEAEIEEYKETQTQLEAEYEEVKRSAAGPDDVTLTENQEAEYERVREAAAAASDQPRRKLTALNRKLEKARSKAANVTQELQEVTNRRNEASRDVTDLKDRRDKLSTVRLIWNGSNFSKRIYEKRYSNILHFTFSLFYRVWKRLRLTFSRPRRSFSPYKSQHRKRKLVAKLSTRKLKKSMQHCEMLETTDAKIRTRSACCKPWPPSSDTFQEFKGVSSTCAARRNAASTWQSRLLLARIWMPLLWIPIKPVLNASSISENSKLAPLRSFPWTPFRCHLPRARNAFAP